jgi:hypothetical protein
VVKAQASKGPDPRDKTLELALDTPGLRTSSDGSVTPYANIDLRMADLLSQKMKVDQDVTTLHRAMDIMGYEYSIEAGGVQEAGADYSSEMTGIEYA